MTVKIDSTVITNKEIMKYQEKERSYLIFNSLLLQSSLINASYIKPGSISFKKSILIKPSTTPK